MRKLALSLIAAVWMTIACPTLQAQDTTLASEDTTAVVEDSTSADSATASSPGEITEEEVEEAPDVLDSEEGGIHAFIKDKMIDGGVEFMSIVLLCLILGLAIAIERVISLNLASTNVQKFLKKVKNKLDTEGVKGAQDFCARTTGPVAGILSQGLVRADEGIEDVKESLENYGAAEMAKLERGMSWVALFISLAPMFGFMGTVLGMIEAFDKIQEVGDIKIGEVAGGIKVALLTTVGGLVVAIILQICYNYLLSVIEKISSQMEDASNEFIDLLVIGKYLKK